MTEKQEYQRVKIGGLWQNTTKNGLTYMSGDLSFGASIQIWPNKKRDGMNDPDFVMYISEKKKNSKDGKGSSAAPTDDLSGLSAVDLANIPF